MKTTRLCHLTTPEWMVLLALAGVSAASAGDITERLRQAGLDTTRQHVLRQMISLHKADLIISTRQGKAGRRGSITSVGRERAKLILAYLNVLAEPAYQKLSEGS